MTNTTGIPADLHQEATARAERFRNLPRQHAPEELRFGQLWTTRPAPGMGGGEEATYPAVAILDPASDPDEARSHGVVVAPISLDMGYASSTDLIVPPDESPLNYACMVEVWNELALLPVQLGRYLGVMRQPFKRYLGLIYQAQLGIVVDLRDVAAHVGPAILHAGDPRIAFQEREVTAHDALRQPLLVQLGVEEAAAEQTVAVVATVAPAIEMNDRAVLRRWPAIKTMVKRGWLEASDAADDLAQRAAAFLGIASFDAPSSVATWVPFRRAQGKNSDDLALLGWVKRVEWLAGQQQVGRFDRTRLEAAMPALMQCAASSHGVREVPQMLLGLGVHFVYVPHLPSTYVDGAAFTLDGRPVIAMSLRRNRVDNFWMTLLHELGHVQMGHTDLHIDVIASPGDALEEQEVAESTGGSDDDERAADRWALKQLIDFDAYERFRDKPRTSEISLVEVKDFARKQGRTPGIVLGLLWKDGALGYHRQRQMLGTKVREDLAGWRDVPAPSDR